MVGDHDTPLGGPVLPGPERGNVEFTNGAELGGNTYRNVDRLPHEGLDVGRRIAEQVGDTAPKNPMPLRTRPLSEGSFVDELRLLHLLLSCVSAVSRSVTLSGLVHHEVMKNYIHGGALCHVDRHRVQNARDGSNQLVGSWRGCLHLVPNQTEMAFYLLQPLDQVERPDEVPPSANKEGVDRSAPTIGRSASGTGLRVGRSSGSGSLARLRDITHRSNNSEQQQSPVNPKCQRQRHA